MAYESPEAQAVKAASDVDATLRARLETAEKTIESLREMAQAAVQAKTDFLARMTHEMRTPLSAIIGLGNLALPLVSDPKLTDYLSTIIASARGLLAVVDDITDFSRLEKGLAALEPAPFELDETLGRVVEAFEQAVAAKGLGLAVRRATAVPVRLVGDHARLQGILTHLVANAVKFTEKGGVDIVVEVAGNRDGGVRLAFTVSDTGIGMAEESIPAMLESFTQADGSLSRPYGGTGLGLALVRRGVALLGGELSVTSRLGEGSRFRFEVPFGLNAPGDGQAADEAAPGPEAAPAAAASPVTARHPLAGTHILLVEDNAINRQVAREILEGFGANVDVAQHGREALEMVGETLYDAVLMDVQMPVMDGLAATRAIRALPGGAELPIVALTAHSLAEDRARCLESGMNDYLTKPIDPPRLLAALGQWIAPAAAAAKQVAPIVDPTAAPRPDKDAAVPALDADTALLRMGGNARLLSSVAGEFVRDYANAGSVLTRLLDEGDLAEARRLAHTVKGVAGNLAAAPLSVAARDLELVLAQGARPEPGLVAAFKNTLAGAAVAASRLGAPEMAAPVATGSGNWRILFVDDAKLNRAIFSQILRGAGNDVVTAVNGKDACRLLFGEKQTGRPFDLIIMDIEMPEMDGPAACRVIRGLLAASVNPPCPPGIPIVALTSHDPAEERGRCLAAGMDACLEKVFEPEELLTSLARIMNGREIKARRSACPRPESGSGTGLTPLVRCLALHLREGNIRVDEDVALLRESLAGRPVPPELAELSQAVEHYEFAAAMEILERLAPRLDVDPAVLAAAWGDGGVA